MSNLDNSSGAAADITLPLFPLKVFLFQGIPLKLQIFERRYLDMVSRQLKANEGFGIVPIAKGEEVGRPPEIYPLGVEVIVTDWDQRPNGLLQLDVMGHRRFEVLDSETQDDGLMVGRIGYLSHDEEIPLDEEYQGLVDLVETLKEHPHNESLGLPGVATTADLANQLAYLLPLSEAEKRRTFLCNDVGLRLEYLAGLVTELSKS
ncbi:LON peptidase substrate-binding domain-containing protein [Aurantivibrio plasticivorans]